MYAMPGVRSEAGPTARHPARRKDDEHNLEPDGVPCPWASPRLRGQGALQEYASTYGLPKHLASLSSA